MYFATELEDGPVELEFEPVGEIENILFLLKFFLKRHLRFLP